MNEILKGRCFRAVRRARKRIARATNDAAK